MSKLLEQYVSGAIFKPLYEATQKATPLILKARTWELIGTPSVMIAETATGRDIVTFGFHPTQIYIDCQCNFIDPTLKRGSAFRQTFSLATFNYDISNCGMTHFHQVQSNKVPRFGGHVLAFIEALAVDTRRKYLTCSISSMQKECGAGIWLTKRGYKVIDEFKGGNSGNMCEVYSKDLSNSPIITPGEIIVQ